MHSKNNILVLGDGGWGTAIAILLDKNGHKVTLWSNFPDYVKYLKTKRENTKFLPGIKIPNSIEIIGDLSRPRRDNLIVMAVPTQHARGVLTKIQSKIRHSPFAIPILSVAKGLEMKTLKRPSEIIKEVLHTDKIAVLSGPSHAEEVARGLPASVIIASENHKLAKFTQHIFMNDHFRPYTHTDVLGVELGGALKNIIAIAAGICEGLKLGDNTKSALLTRGLVEIARFGKAKGAQPMTFFGLSGIGDLITTCISPYGRNRMVGLRLGKGESLKQILGSMEMVAEGIWTTQAAYKLAKQLGVEMPITNEVYKVLFHNKKPRQAVLDLMRRPPKSETEDLTWLLSKRYKKQVSKG